MQYLKQFLIILIFCFLGQLLEVLLPFPIPAAIYGLVLLLTALSTGILKPEAISDTARFLIRIMPVLFVAPGVRLLEYWGLIASDIVPILIISIFSTLIVFAVSCLVTQAFLRRKEQNRHA